MKSESKTFPLIAKTIFGLENVLAEELKKLNAQKIEIGNRAVFFEGDKELMYKANLYLRTTLRVLKPIEKFYVRSDNALYKNIKKIKWDNYFSVDETFSIDSVVHSKYFNHSKYVSLKAKDAIVDQYREQTGKRPNVELDDPTIKINIHIYDDECTVSLDSSGDSLHRRGYRKSANLAPLSEVLAAGLIYLSGWDQKSNFTDAMCGSGTILIEAGLIAANKAPGLIRKKFGFMNWKDYDVELWNKLLKEAGQKITPINFKITGSDINKETINIAKENITLAGLDKNIIISVKPFSESKPPEGEGTLIINPPYGERMKEDDIIEFYKMIGDTLKQNYTGYDAWIISSNKEALKYLGLRTSKKLSLQNGPLEVKFHKYEMYQGSKKAKYN